MLDKQTLMAAGADNCGCVVVKDLGRLICPIHLFYMFPPDEQTTRKHLRRIVNAVYEFGDDPQAVAGVLAELVVHADAWLEKNQDKDVKVVAANTEMLWDSFCRMRMEGKTTEQQAFLHTLENFIVTVLRA